MLGVTALTTLVSRLSIEQGYIKVYESSFDDVPCTVENYTNAVLDAEGYTPASGGEYYREARRVVSEVFEKYYVAG